MRWDEDGGMRGGVVKDGDGRKGGGDDVSERSGMM